MNEGRCLGSIGRAEWAHGNAHHAILDVCADPWAYQNMLHFIHLLYLTLSECSPSLKLLVCIISIDLCGKEIAETVELLTFHEAEYAMVYPLLHHFCLKGERWSQEDASVRRLSPSDHGAARARARARERNKYNAVMRS